MIFVVFISKVTAEIVLLVNEMSISQELSMKTCSMPKSCTPCMADTYHHWIVRDVRSPPRAALRPNAAIFELVRALDHILLP